MLGGKDASADLLSPPAVPLSLVIPYTHFDVQFLEKFGVTFRREGETLTLKCTMLVTPDLKRVQPRAEWYRDGEWHNVPGSITHGAALVI